MLSSLSVYSIYTMAYMLQSTEIISSTTWDQFWIRQHTTLTLVIQRHFQFSVTVCFPHEHQTLPPNNNDRSTKGNQVLDFRILLLIRAENNRAHFARQKMVSCTEGYYSFLEQKKWCRHYPVKLLSAEPFLPHFSNEVIVTSEYYHRIIEKYYRESSGMKNNVPSPKGTKDQK